MGTPHLVRFLKWGSVENVGFPYDFPIISLWFPYDFPIISLWFPYDFPIISLWFPYDFQKKGSQFAPKKPKNSFARRWKARNSTAEDPRLDI